MNHMRINTATMDPTTTRAVSSVSMFGAYPAVSRLVVEYGLEELLSTFVLRSKQYVIRGPILDDDSSVDECHSIADLSGEPQIAAEHVAEAIAYRRLDRQLN